MVATNTKDLSVFLKENKIDTKKLKKTLQKYVDENCKCLLANDVNFELFFFREAITDFIELITVSDQIIDI